MVIQDTDVLQADATVITGILILLTISTFAKGERPKTISDVIKGSLSIVAFAIIIVFSVSAIAEAEGSVVYGKDIMIIGFVILICGILYILVMGHFYARRT